MSFKFNFSPECNSLIIIMQLISHIPLGVDVSVLVYMCAESGRARACARLAIQRRCYHECNNCKIYRPRDVRRNRFFFLQTDRVRTFSQLVRFLVQIPNPD